MAKKINLLSQYTKDEILNAIETVCDYSVKRLIESFCECERLNKEDKRLSENIVKCKQTKNEYLAERERLITKYGEIDKIPFDNKMHLLQLQQAFLDAVCED